MAVRVELGMLKGMRHTVRVLSNEMIQVRWYLLVVLQLRFSACFGMCSFFFYLFGIGIDKDTEDLGNPSGYQEASSLLLDSLERWVLAPRRLEACGSYRRGKESCGVWVLSTWSGTKNIALRWKHSVNQWDIFQYLWNGCSILLNSMMKWVCEYTLWLRKFFKHQSQNAWNWRRAGLSCIFLEGQWWEPKAQGVLRSLDGKSIFLTKEISNLPSLKLT